MNIGETISKKRKDLGMTRKDSFESVIYTTMNRRNPNAAISSSTLYVSDLDGTLMRNDQTLSPKTIETINFLVEKGVNFTYATARSISSSRAITKDLHLRIPVITRNGCVLADNNTGTVLEKSIFSESDVVFLRENLPELSHTGFVSSYEEDEMYKTYCGTDHSYGLKKYINAHISDHRMKQIEEPGKLFQGVIGYVTMIDDREKLLPVYERMKTNPHLECVFQKDTYGDEYWLEICPENSTKANAILQLKERLGFDKLVVFGDSVNDLSMFRIADESYAVKNAIEEVRLAATAVIGTNEEDAVAEFLQSVKIK